MPRPRRLLSALLARAWNVPGIGRVRVLDLTSSHLEEIDAEWPAARKPTDWHLSWRWAEITSGKVEVFVAVGPDDKVRGIWCSAKHKPITLPDGTFYRTDYLEVAPNARGQEMGVFMFLLIATRALELGATGVVLGTWEVLRGFYGQLGGAETTPRGWNLEPNLIPFVFDSETLEGLREALARMEDHGQGTTNI